MTSISSSRKKNGYSLIPSIDPDGDSITSVKTRPKPPDLKPGLFVQFSKDRRIPRYGGTHSESEEIEMKDLKPRKKLRKIKSPKSPSSKRHRIETVEEPVLDGDTIQRIALRYSCPVAELRRVNKLYNDLDLHALKTIKIPIREHSLLLEASERERRRNLVTGDSLAAGSSGGATSTDEAFFGGPSTYYGSDDNQTHDDECYADDEEGNDSDTPEYRDISIQSALKWKHSRQTLLEKLDKDLEKARTNVENQKSNVKEVQIIFDSPSIHPISVQEYTKQVFELPDWRILAAVSLFIFIIVLVGIVVYYKRYKDTAPVA